MLLINRWGGPVITDKFEELLASAKSMTIHTMLGVYLRQYDPAALVIIACSALYSHVKAETVAEFLRFKHQEFEKKSGHKITGDVVRALFWEKWVEQPPGIERWTTMESGNDQEVLSAVESLTEFLSDYTIVNDKGVEQKWNAGFRVQRDSSSRIVPKWLESLRREEAAEDLKWVEE